MLYGKEKKNLIYMYSTAFNKFYEIRNFYKSMNIIWKRRFKSIKRILSTKCSFKGIIFLFNLGLPSIEISVLFSNI